MSEATAPEASAPEQEPKEPGPLPTYTAQKGSDIVPAHVRWINSPVHVWDDDYLIIRI